MKVISFWNHCGGTGKSTSTAWAVKYLSEMGFNVLAVDCDPQGVLTRIHAGVMPSLGRLNEALRGKATLNAVSQYSEALGCYVVAADDSLTEAISWMGDQMVSTHFMRNAVAKARADVVLLDIGTAADRMMINCLVASDYVVIPCYAAQGAVHGAQTVINTVEMVKALNPSLSVLGSIITKVDLRDGAPWPLDERKAIAQIERLAPPVLGMIRDAKGQDQRVQLACGYKSIVNKIAEVLK